MTQGDLAEKADLSLDMVGRIERGTTSPSFASMIALANALDVPVAVLIGGRPVSGTDNIDKEAALERIVAMLDALDTEDVLWMEQVITDVLKR